MWRHRRQLLRPLPPSRPNPTVVPPLPTASPSPPWPISLLASRPCPPTPEPFRCFRETLACPVAQTRDFLDLLLRRSRGLSSVARDVARCWNCGAAAPADGDGLPFLACGACRSVQPVDPSVDYFQIFGMEKNYEVKDENLQGKYKDWQKKLHPDLFHSKSEKEKNYAAEQSPRVTNAYRTLSKPLSRALYLLQIEGIHVDEEKTISDPELLAEIMEIREAVDEAKDLSSLKQMQAELHQKLDEWSSFFAEAFKKRDFEDAKASILRMTYYERAKEEIVTGGLIAAPWPSSYNLITPCSIISVLVAGVGLKYYTCWISYKLYSRNKIINSFLRMKENWL